MTRWLTVASIVACGPKAPEHASATSSGVVTGSDGDASTAALSSGKPTSSGSTSTTGTTGSSTLPLTPDLPCGVDCTTTGSYIGPIPDLPAPACNIQAQDCPAGQKCVPYSSDGASIWDAAGCFSVVDEPVGLGELCIVEDNPYSGHDNCEVGAMCWSGDGTDVFTCAPLCSGSLDTLSCPPEYFCTYYWEQLTVCEQAACDPLLQDCPDPDELCLPNIYAWEDWCLPDESPVAAQVHEPCESETDCAKGLACLYPPEFVAVECTNSDPGVGCCEPFCEVGVDTCPGVGQVCTPSNYPGVGICYLP